MIPPYLPITEAQRRALHELLDAAISRGLHFSLNIHASHFVDDAQALVDLDATWVLAGGPPGLEIVDGGPYFPGEEYSVDQIGPHVTLFGPHRKVGEYTPSRIGRNRLERTQVRRDVPYRMPVTAVSTPSTQAAFR